MGMHLAQIPEIMHNLQLDSLAYLFRKHGYEVLAVNEVFGEQFLTIEARVSPVASLAPPVQAAELDWVAAACQQKVTTLSKNLACRLYYH